MGDLQAAETVRDQYGLRTADAHRRLQRPHPFGACHTIPIAGDDALHEPVARLPQRLPVVRAGVPDAREHQNGRSHRFTSRSCMGCDFAVWILCTPVLRLLLQGLLRNLDSQTLMMP